jgi:hypothetical protein
LRKNVTDDRQFGHEVGFERLDVEIGDVGLVKGREDERMFVLRDAFRFFARLRQQSVDRRAGRKLGRLDADDLTIDADAGVSVARWRETTAASAPDLRDIRQ